MIPGPQMIRQSKILRVPGCWTAGRHPQRAFDNRSHATYGRFVEPKDRLIICRRCLLLATFFGLALQTLGQPWRTPSSLLLFRGTAAQDVAARVITYDRKCLSNLSRVELAARIYAIDNQDRLPSDWLQFTNGISDPSILFCPADLDHPVQTNWATVDLAAISYELVGGGVNLDQVHTPFIRCRVHGNYVSVGAVVTERLPYDPAGFPAIRAGGLWVNPKASPAIKESSVSLACRNQLMQIGVAARVFATDNLDILPSTFADFADSLYSLQDLVCPADLLLRPPATVSDAFGTNVSYVIDAPGVSDESPSVPFIHCRIHGHRLYSDGSVALGTNRYPPRLILGPPMSQTVELGKTATFSVLTGDETLGAFRYQWRRVQPFDSVGLPYTNVVDQLGATNRDFSIPNAQPESEGYYDVIVWDSTGQYQVSPSAYLRVEPLANLEAEYSWERVACRDNLRGLAVARKLIIIGQTNSSPAKTSELIPFLGWPLSLICPSDPARVAPSSWEGMNLDDVSYDLDFSLAADAVTNIFATCKIHGDRVLANGTLVASPSAPEVDRHPLSQTSFVGRNVSLFAAALSEPLATNQWFMDGRPIEGQTATELALTNLILNAMGSYYAVFTNVFGSATSHVAILTVNPIPQPTLQFSSLPRPGVPESTLTVAGPEGIGCELQGSGDLAHWSLLSSNTITGGTLTFTNLSLSDHQGFFRTVFR